MSSSANPRNTGDGTRPTTDGGVDNIGAGSKFTESSGAGEVNGPAPAERMQQKRSDRAGTKADDSAAFGLTDSTATTPNTEPDVAKHQKGGSS